MSKLVGRPYDLGGMEKEKTGQGFKERLVTDKRILQLTGAASHPVHTVTPALAANDV